MRIRIGSRGSDLALWQARHVQSLLETRCDAEVEIVVIKTEGDRIQDVPLTPDLGKSFFTKEIEQALLDRQVDLAVHSLKDLAVDEPPGLALAAVPAREHCDERLLIHPDAFDIAGHYLPLREGAVVGTSSPRRQRRLRELRPDLEIRELRGNVPTRVAKCQNHVYDAILIARAGVTRLGLELAPLHVRDLPLELFCGAAGQGALGLQTREGDTELRALLKRLEDPDTERATRVERRLLKSLGGGCSLPFGAHATIQPDAVLRLRAYLFPPDGPGGSLQFAGEDADEDALIAQATEALRPALERPLAGRRLWLLGGPRIPALRSQLESAGADVAFFRCFDYENLPLDLVDLDALTGADHLLVASKHAAARLHEELGRAERVLPTQTTLLVTGVATGQLVRALFPRNEVVLGEPPRSLGMGQVAAARGAQFVVSLGAENGSDEGAAHLREQGIKTRSVPVYRNVPTPGAEERWHEAVREHSGAPLLYLSPTAAHCAPPKHAPADCPVLAIGPATAAALESEGHRQPRVAPRPELGAVLRLLTEVRSK